MTKRVISILFSLMLIMGLLTGPVQVRAAAADSKAGIVATGGSRLNVRSGASTGASVLTSLPKGSYVTLIARSGDWWRVEYAKGRYGYCHADYIQTAQSTAAKVATQSTSLNVRSGAGTSYAKVASLAKGETVLVLSTSGSWSRILYHGTRTGYVSSQYLSTGNAPVSLSVPSFKQTDGRWASATIGSTGKTIAQIGCATTAVAMMESYRTGSTIYPDAMAKKLRYTSTGDLYWPANFVAVTEGGYLNGVYSLLKQGKPVLFGARNAYGKQHWVVITGFTGGAITASSFAIHDPGSNSRVNLQQFLNAYPTFYKYFYYS